MDFDQAKNAHFDWKRKLAEYLKKPDGSLKSADVGLDNKCVLGQWIYGEGQKYKQLPEYQNLIALHAKFHKCAADVIKKADSGASVSEEIALGSKSEFASASTAVITAINTIARKAV